MFKYILKYIKVYITVYSIYYEHEYAIISIIFFQDCILSETG
jgi:hypothetical protein